MALELRPITEDEAGPFQRCMATAFGEEFREEDVARHRSTTELDRTLAVFDDGTLVSTAGAISFVMGIPGGTIPCAGVTNVTVLPTHRRRGILTAMMARQLADVRERGEPVAALWASESVIYGRFGYGLAAQVTKLEIAHDHADFQAEPQDPGRVRIVTAAEAAGTWPAVWERAIARHPGMMSRSQSWWQAQVWDDVPHWRDGYTANVYVSHERDGKVDGLLRYRTKANWDSPLPAASLQVEDLVADDDDAYAALWRFALSKDLVATISAHHRRVDEPLYWMLADPRRLRRTLDDALWVRLVDIPVALGARRYSASGRVVFSLRDAFVPANSGTFALDVGADGLGRCTRTTDAGDIGLHVEDLGAAYLGGVTFSTLGAAGRVKGSPEALRRADQLFNWSAAPWCPEVF